MNTTFTYFTFDEWKDANPDLKATVIEEECFDCDGTGEHHCECGDEHECNSCDGTGKSKETITLQQIYADQRKSDEAALAKYLARLPQ